MEPAAGQAALKACIRSTRHRSVRRSIASWTAMDAKAATAKIKPLTSDGTSSPVLSNRRAATKAPTNRAKMYTRGQSGGGQAPPRRRMRSSSSRGSSRRSGPSSRTTLSPKSAPYSQAGPWDAQTIPPRTAAAQLTNARARMTFSFFTISATMLGEIGEREGAGRGPAERRVPCL